MNDVLVKNIPLSNAAIGDLLVFERVGAYSVTEGIYLFLSRDLPRIFFYSRKCGMQLMRDRKEQMNGIRRNNYGTIIRDFK